MKSLRKSSVPELDMETANRILKQAFEANQMEDNSIPLEVLTSYSNYRRNRFAWQRTILVIIIVLFLLLPLLFVPPAFTINEDKSTVRNFNPIYRVEIGSFLLAERVNATIDGYNIPVYETDANVYSIEPSRNGRMEVTVTLVNKQTKTQYVDVTTVDRDMPVVTSCTKKGDLIYLYLSDSGSGIDFPAIQATDINGQEVMPVSVDEAAGYVIFSGETDTLTIFVQDLAGNKLQLILSIQ